MYGIGKSSTDANDVVTKLKPWLICSRKIKV